ncbi:MULTISPECIES: DUF3313 family protein [Kordiimonas]|jgi:hypothetical protein|uniref:DUF3313 family protein n=1 Tax=Kordiimonas TaxID=288021 RepID=UPI00257A6F8B|nr:DUF3313 family protein [Kordiimonas sp. UBA4487]
MKTTFKKTMIAGSVALACLMGATAPAFAGFYNSPDLKPVAEDLGLEQVKAKGLDKLYVKKGTDFSKYSGLVLQDLEFSYSQDFRERPVNDRDEDRMALYFRQAIEKRFRENDLINLAAETGENNLMLKVTVVGLALNLSKEVVYSPRNKTFARSAGALEIVGELRDSSTGELLAVFKDEEDNETSFPRQITSVQVWSDVKQVFYRWSKQLDKSLTTAITR